jgi:glycosyltransferase 2 family protein
MNKSLRIVLGLSVSAFCLWLVFRNLDWPSVVQALKQAKWSWFLPITLVYMTAHILRSFRWHVLLSPVQKVPARTLFSLLMFGFLVNNLLPARTGEVARAFAASRKTGLPTSTLLGSIAMERLTDLLGLAVIMMIASTVLPMDRLPIKQVGMFFLCGLAVIGLLLLFHRYYGQKTGQSPWIAKLSGFLSGIIQGFASLNSPLTIGKIAFLSIAIWMIEAVTLMMGAHAFGLALRFNQASALLSGISFGVMIPAAPGYIGTYEYFGSETLRLLGFQLAVALPFVLSFHFFQMVLTSALGVPTLIKVGIPSNKQ